LIAANALRLALLAALGVVRELFVVEKNLLAGCKNKIGAAVNALQDSIREFHSRLPKTGTHIEIGYEHEKLAGPGSLLPFVMHN